MIAQIRAELLKIRSTRTTLGLILGMIALILLFTLLTGLLTHTSGLASKEDQRQLLSVGSFAGVFSALAGVLLVTSEYRFGTIRPTILFNPARSHVLAAKVVAGALAGIAFGVLGEAVSWAIGYAILDGRGITVVLGSGDILLLTLGGLAGAALWGAIGAGLGAIIHNQVGGVIALLAWGLVVDNLLFGLAPSVGRFMPTRASDALMGLQVDHLVSPGAGAITLKSGPALPVRYLHGYHRVVPPIALIAPFARMARSTNRPAGAADPATRKGTTPAAAAHQRAG